MKKIYLLILLSFFTYSCLDLPDKMIAPTWDIEFNIPIIDEIYYLDEIIRVDENIKIDSSMGKKVYYVESENYNNRFGVSEFIRYQLDGRFFENVPVLTGDSLIGVAISSGAEVDSAHLKEGILTAKIINNSNEEVVFSVKMPKFKDKNGSVFGFNGTIPPLTEYNESFNLADYRYAARDQVNKNELQFMVDSKPSNTSNDILNIDITLSNSDFYYIEGKLPSRKVRDINELVSLPLTDDVRELKDNVEFTNAQMIISAEYLSKHTEIFTSEFRNFQIEGVSNTGEKMYLTDRDGNTNLGDIQIYDGSFERIYDNTNSNISDFLSFMPDQVFVKSEVYLNPTEGKGISTDKDSINVSLKIVSTSDIVIRELTLTDTLAFEIDDEMRREIKNGRLAELFYQIENAIPIEHNMKFIFLDSNKVELFPKDVDLPGARVIDANRNISAREVNDILKLNADEILQLADAYYILFEWTVFTDQDPYTAYFSKEQYFKIKAFCRLIYNVNIR
jgi:hypothetical protein